MLHIATDTNLEVRGEYPSYTGHFHDEGNESVDFTAHLPENRECKHCYGDISEYVEGWTHDDTDSRYCDSIDLQDDEKKEAEPAPAAPGNWVGFSVNPERQETQVQISVGDPRSCFTFTLRRWKDPQTGTEELLLHLPHPGQGLGHATLVPHHDGTYLVR